MLLTCHGYLVGPIKEQRPKPSDELIPGLALLESKALTVLRRCYPHPVAYDVLIKQVWPDGNGSRAKLVQVVYRLRIKIPSAEISNVYGFGFQLDERR